MAEMTLDMYGAVGKFGNKVFYQRGGKTIERTITKPKNPKTNVPKEGSALSRSFFLSKKGGKGKCKNLKIIK